MKILLREDKLFPDTPHTLQARAGEQLRKDLEKMGAKILKVTRHGAYGAVDVDLRGVRREQLDQVMERLAAESVIPEPIDVPAFLNQRDRGTAVEAAARGVLKVARRLPLAPEEVAPFMEKLAFKGFARGPAERIPGMEFDNQGEVRLTAQEEAAIAKEIKAAGLELPPETDMRTPDEIELEKIAEEQRLMADIEFVEEKERLQKKQFEDLERKVFFQ